MIVTGGVGPLAGQTLTQVNAAWDWYGPRSVFGDLGAQGDHTESERRRILIDHKLSFYAADETKESR